MHKFFRFKNESPGFNRYMVECEFFKKESEVKMFFVLIDTWWNVNIPIARDSKLKQAF